MKRTYLFILMAVVAICANAAAPNGSGTYYQNANGKQGAALKTALCGIIYNRTEKSYDYLWTAFKATDVRSTGKIWDMYSDITNYTPVTKGSSYSEEGDCYNREHSFPQSWFGSNAPMYTDLHHIYPTDGFVNGKRANYPFGETTGNKYKSANNFSKLGDCTYSGYTGTVFEPADEYKGDFARTYFYMVTCYEEKLHDWVTNYGKSTEVDDVLDGNTYPGLKTWQLNMLLAWAAADPVSEKETARNNAVYGIQRNRNPFIDYPGLEQYIWGSKTEETFSYDNYVRPDGSGGQGGGIVVSGDAYVKITSTSDLEDGQYLIVYEGGSLIFDGSLTTLDAVGNTQSVTISDNTIEATSTVNGYAFTYNAAAKTLRSASGYYIGNTSDSNGLSANTSTTYTNTISFDTDGNANIVGSGGAYLRYNSDSNQTRFRYYKSSTYTSQKAIQLYKFVESSALDPVTYNTATTVSYGSQFTLVNGTDFITDGTVTLTSSNEAVATVDGLTVTPLAAGDCIISVTYGATANYKASNSVFIFTVTPPEGKTEAAPSEAGLLFGESFGNNSSSARDWNNSYSVKSGINAVYSGITGYTITNAKQSKNTMGSIDSGLTQTTQGTDASIIIGPLNVEDYTSLNVSYQWKAASIKGTYYTDLYYATSSTGTYNKVTGTGTGATTFVERSYSLPTDAQVNTLFLKIVWNTSNTSGIIDEVSLNGSAASTLTTTLNSYGYATFCSEYPLDFTDVTDFSAWQITGVSGTTIIFEQVTGKVKGGTGLLLKGEANATVSLLSAASENELAGNLLCGTIVPTYVYDETNYGLCDQTFVKVNAGIVPEGKALLPASALTSGVKAFSFVFENDPDGINSLNPTLSEGEGAIYNLAGQRIDNSQFTIHNSQLKRGIYIVNGKKILK